MKIRKEHMFKRADAESCRHSSGDLRRRRLRLLACAALTTLALASFCACGQEEPEAEEPETFEIAMITDGLYESHPKSETGRREAGRSGWKPAGDGCL